MTPTIITEELVTSFQEKLVTAQKLKREFLVLRRQLDSSWFVGGKHGFDPFNFPLLDRISKHAICNDLDQDSANSALTAKRKHTFADEMRNALEAYAAFLGKLASDNVADLP